MKTIATIYLVGAVLVAIRCWYVNRQRIRRLEDICTFAGIVVLFPIVLVCEVREIWSEWKWQRSKARHREEVIEAIRQNRDQD